MSSRLTPDALVLAGACSMLIALIWEVFLRTMGASFPALRVVAATNGWGIPDVALLLVSVGLCLAGLAWLLVTRLTDEA